MDTENIHLSTREVARLLEVGKHQIVNLCHNGLLCGASKIKGQWRIPASAVHKYENDKKGKVLIGAETLRQVRSYLLHYLSTLGAETQVCGTALTELYAKPYLDNYSQERLKDLEASLVGISRRIEEVWAAIRRLDDGLRFSGFGSMFSELEQKQGG